MAYIQQLSLLLGFLLPLTDIWEVGGGEPMKLAVYHLLAAPPIKNEAGGESPLCRSRGFLCEEEDCGFFVSLAFAIGSIGVLFAHLTTAVEACRSDWQSRGRSEYRGI